jgi:hypothetical protein
LVVLNGGRLEQDAAVESGEHHSGAGLGAVDAKKGEVFGPNRLDAWVNHTPRLVEGVRLSLAMIPRSGFDRHRTEPPDWVERRLNSNSGGLLWRGDLKVFDRLLLLGSVWL